MKKEMALTDGRVLEVEVIYSKGGANFMSGNHERRGYSLHISPVKIENKSGYTIRSFTISGRPEDRGIKSFLLEVKKQSPKATLQAEEIAVSRLNRVLNEWLSRSGCELVQPIPPHSIVGYTELGTILLTAAAPAAATPVPVARGMKLLTKEVLERLPALGATGDNPDPIVQVKFFDPTGSWTWGGIEYDPNNKIFFGIVKGFEVELGDFSLMELESIRGNLGIGIERDLHFKPCKLSEFRATLER